MALNTGLNPDLVKTAIDEVVYPEFDREDEPQEVLATNPIFFKQESTDRQAVITDEYEGPGLFEAHDEEESIKSVNIRTGNQKTHTVLNYKKQVKIPVEFFEDDMHSAVGNTVEQFGLRARTSRDKHAYENSYGDAFSGVTTSDAVALISNSHTAMNGDTIDNLETGALTAANLETVVRALRLQKAQDGEVGGHNVVGLLVSPTDFPDAIEIAESELQTGTGNNNLNYFSRIYPGMVIGTSAFLDSTYNSLNTNTNTSYFAVSRHHTIRRYKRLGLNTTLVSPDTDDQDRYTYKARFREVVSAVSWEGIIGSNGTV
jgi:hypothetical protein